MSLLSFWYSYVTDIMDAIYMQWSNIKVALFTYACLFGRLAIDMFLSLFLPGLPLSRFTAFSLFRSHILGVTLSAC